MRLIALAVILALSLALARLAAETQQAALSQPRQVGWLGVVAGPPLQDEFRRGMRELGHVEGAGPIARWGRGKIERPETVLTTRCRPSSVPA
jgi:hypothetical protein